MLFLEHKQSFPAQSCFSREMAAEFSVQGWLSAAGWSQYETQLLEHGCHSYESCASLSKADLLAAGLDNTDASILANRVDDLRAMGSEEDAIRELSVSSKADLSQTYII